MATNSNETYDPKEKTTKLVRGIHSWIKFQKHQGVESLTIEGKQALADVSQDKNGDASLILKADLDKVDYVQSNVPYLRTSHTQDGTDPYQEKTAVISQDLTQFPLTGGELVTVTKTEDNLTIHDDKVKEFVATTVTAKETEIKQFIGEVKEELTTKINEHSGGTSAEPFDKETFKDDVLEFIKLNHNPVTMLSDIQSFQYDNMFYGFTDINGVRDSIEISITYKSRVIESLLLKREDFINNNTYENEKMYIKLYKSDMGADVIGGGDIVDESGKGQLRFHVTLKENTDINNFYTFVRYYLTNPAESYLNLQKLSGDGTRLTAESMTQ